MPLFVFFITLISSFFSLILFFFLTMFVSFLVSSLPHFLHSPLPLPPPPSLLPFFSFVLSTEIHKNVISPLEGDAKEHVLHQKHTELKQKMKDLNQGFERLRKLSHEGFTEDSGEGDNTHKCKCVSSLFLHSILTLHLFYQLNHWDLQSQ